MPAKKKLNFSTKEDEQINAYIDTTDEAQIKVIESIKENELYDKMKDEELPEHISRIKSWWKRPAFGLSQLIEMNQYIDKVNPQTMRLERVFDYNALIIARIRVLLKNWNLDEFDGKYKLSFEKAMENSSYVVLSADSMTKVLNIYPPELITNLYNKMLMSLFPDDPFVRALKMQQELEKAEAKLKEEDAKNLKGEQAKA
jgi:hypothetical protein